MSNPLLELDRLPAFSQIKPAHIEPAIDELLQINRKEIATLLTNEGNFSWKNLVEPIEQLEDRLSRTWSPVSHMNSVINSEELREAYNACLPKLSEYGTEMGQNEALFRAYEYVAANDQSLNASQKKVMQNALRDFHLSGVDLPQEKKERFKELSQQMSKLTSKFEENILDSTNAWSKLITDVEQLVGLPESAIALAKQSAEQRELEGWLLTLEFPSYLPIMTYADNRELRHELYQAFSTRASDQGPQAGQWDNSKVMEEILANRHEKAQLLSFDNYAERSLATKMARNPNEVISFLEDLAERSHPQAQHELDELRDYAKQQFAVEQLEAWDIGYYAEKLRQFRYNISQEELKPYLPEERVITGMFKVVERLYGIKVSEVEGVDSWHTDVRFFKIHDANGELRGEFYLDLYARRFKRGGAWMDECVGRFISDTKNQTPVAYLTCNFSPPVGDKPALFTHDEVETLFHEFGHGLHHMLTKINYPAISGISGVSWDAVELPSQFMENWCWQHEALQLISGHYETSEPIPDELYERMIAAKNFQSAMQMVRQLEFSLFDFRIHREYEPKKGGRVYEILEQVRQQVAVLQPPSWNRFPHGFSHIFAGGYAAGYYSYKWAEVLSADAFSLFEEQGIFNAEAGASFLQNILEMGGSKDAMELFIAFRGREPKIDALLTHCGIS